MNYLFIAMDDDRRAHPEYLDSAQAVCDAVKRSCFYYPDGEEWSPEHIEEAAALTEDLLENGKLSFEGDPPLYLFQLPDDAVSCPLNAQRVKQGEQTRGVSPTPGGEQ